MQKNDYFQNVEIENLIFVKNIDLSNSMTNHFQKVDLDKKHILFISEKTKFYKLSPTSTLREDIINNSIMTERTRLIEYILSKTRYSNDTKMTAQKI